MLLLLLDLKNDGDLAAARERVVLEIGANAETWSGEEEKTEEVVDDVTTTRAE